MGTLEELGIDSIGSVHIAQEDWHQTALSMIGARRKQVIAAEGCVTTEEQREAVLMELKRMSDLEFYVRSCAALNSSVR